jgi:CRP-like cAMP-binding protein
MNILKQSQERIKRLTLDELKPILRHFQPVRVSAKTTLLEPGGVSGAIWYVDTGILRSYMVLEEEKRASPAADVATNREITNWIVSEGGFLTDTRSFLHRTPALAYIETLEASKLYKLSHENYLHIHRLFPDLFRTLFENTLILSELRVQMCNLRNPIQRVQMFEHMHPELAGRISVGLQASYLNIDRATLSRIRSKRQ